ncbi:ABC transporter substrate-binding protein [Clostridium sp. BL-8]|uniref:ABC transporter substrate-binding protein n=1 Tax=Clostridium sp. BL-8 TaxID=349938 RepID=UPI0009C8334B|nr:ABC transporter substrate-binding protein [Clostridium sp. BL-8]OOM79527.1 vitamin B12-binding protein [Clostridium sp. BL-8]
MNKRIIAVISSLIVTTSMLIGCGAKQVGGTETSKSTEVNNSQKRELTDAFGHDINLPQKVSRVSTTGALNQIVLMLGGGDKIVATQDALKTSFFAKIYPRIKDVASAYSGGGSGTINVETVLAQKPDVVFSSIDEDKRPQMDAAGVPMVGVKLVTTDDMKDTVKLVGQVLGDGSDKKAEEFIKYYDDNLNYVKEKTKDAKKIKVFVASGDASKGSISTIPDKDIDTEYINAAGGENIVSKYISTGPTSGTVSEDFEFLIKEQPDVIIANTKEAYDYIVDKSNGSQWQNVEAVKNNKVYLNPKGTYLWAVRSAEGALQPLWLAKVLHPDLFQDLDINKKVKEFYKNYYNYDLSDQEVDDIMNQRV